MTVVVYCFRDDLRLHDNPALQAACAQASHVLPVYVLPEPQQTAWGFARHSQRQQAFRVSALHALAKELQARGSRLLLRQGRWATELPALLQHCAATALYCEEPVTPEELADVQALRSQGLCVQTYWQSTLLAPQTLPWSDADCPDVFSTFRQRVERLALPVPAPLPAPSVLPPLPPQAAELCDVPLIVPTVSADHRSSFPFPQPAFNGGEAAAQAHVRQYLARGLPHSYKATRNGLQGIDYSSKFSPWLALGALSPRWLLQALREFEAEHGSSDGSYWLWFELLWRDYFKWLHRKYGRKLYRAGGLPGRQPPPHDAEAFQRWQHGCTGQPLVDAGLRELAATGYLGNRMRQIVASYLINELRCDWRAGAAWFEANLLDYDCCSNHGNWLYIAGLGTDPRGGRHFNVLKQSADYDADGSYRRLWGTA